MSQVIAESPIPPEAFKEHPGQWVAVRGSALIAWAASLEALTSKPEVRGTDTLMHVPEATTHFYRCHG